MGCGLAAKFEGDVVVAEAAAAPIVAQVEAVVPQAQGEERYYTDAEINALPAQQGNTYRAKMREGKTPNEIRGIFTRIMKLQLVGCLLVLLPEKHLTLLQKSILIKNKKNL
jgi:hypothetical protein